MVRLPNEEFDKAQSWSISVVVSLAVPQSSEYRILRIFVLPGESQSK